MSDIAPTPDADEARAVFASRLDEAGILTRRFIDVRDGEKGTRTPGHQQPENWFEADDDDLSGNYGVHPGHGLIEFDVDDYEDEHDTDALDALPETFTVESPHTNDESPGHRYYAVEDDEGVTEVLEDIAGTLNPEPVWGEVKYDRKYVVGPGSQLNGCSKEWCDECAGPDGGYYRIAEDRPIATITTDDLAAVLHAEFSADADEGEEIDTSRLASEQFELDDEEDIDADHEEKEEWLTEADIREALEHIDPDVGNDKWVRIGYALGEFFDASTALELYEEWSRGGTKWDNEAERRAPDIIDDADPGGDATIGSVVELAKRGGWDLSTCPSAEARREKRRQGATDGGTVASTPDPTTPGESAEDVEPDVDDLTEAILDEPGAWFDEGEQTVTIHPVDGFALDALAERFESDDIPDRVIADVAMGIDDGARAAFKAWDDADAGEWDVEIADVDTETWDDIIPEFYADTKTTRGERKDRARYRAVQRLLSEKEILQTKEGRTVFIYDPERGYYRRDGAEAELETHLETRLSHAFSPARSSRIIKTACARRRAFADELGGPDRELCLANGVLDLNDLDGGDPDLTLSPHTHTKWFTAGLPVDYDADADCPRFDQFIEESVEADDRAKLQEFAGYCLLVNEQPFKKALFLVGPTDSGKGTFLKVIENLIGFENVATQSLHSLTDTRWGPHSLFGRAINIRNEISRRDVKNPQKFKELTGGEDPIDAEDKGESKYKYIVTQKLLFATNQFPEVEGADDAFYNRLLFASFPNRVPDSRKDHDLDEKLEAELPGILNWAIEGLARLLENEQFTDVRDQQAKESLVEQFGGLEERFAHACLDITGDEGDMVVKGDLHDLALTYATHSGVDERPTQRVFTTSMKKMEGIGTDKQRVDGTSEGVYTGVRVESKALTALGADVRSRTSDGTGSDPQARLDGESEPDAGDSNQEDDEPDGDQEDEESQGSGELAVSSARKPITKTIEESESDDGATTEDVVEAVPHTPEKAREHIEAMFEDGIITRDDDGRLRIA